MEFITDDLTVREQDGISSEKLRKADSALWEFNKRFSFQMTHDERVAINDALEIVKKFMNMECYRNI